MTSSKTRQGFFEGFLLGILILDLLAVAYHGWSFPFVELGEIKAVTSTLVVIYVSIVFILYEFVLERNALQSCLYTLTGYFCLDDMCFIAHFYQVSTSFSLFLYNIFTSSSFIFTYLLIIFLYCYHRGLVNRFLSHAAPFYQTDCAFHFKIKRLALLMTLFSIIFYVVQVQVCNVTLFGFIFYPLYFPLLAYILSNKNLKVRL